jgi:hypothetical protein
MSLQTTTVAESNCVLIGNLLDRLLYKYWLNQNKRFDDPGAYADFCVFLEEAKAELQQKP